MSLILGIESSCDETGVAVYDTKKKLVSNVLFSQTELHKNYGGVVPEISSRAQLEKINVVIQQALDSARVTLDDIDVIAVTNRPGLPGSLLVGVCFAKALAYAKQKKLIGINHLEGHAFSVFLEHDVPFPFLCITASGGHTSLYKIDNFGDYKILGKTTDDAAGEAFDKVAKMMNYPYPGGPVIETLAQEVGFQDFFHYPRLKSKTFDFSFSGLKTAVLYDLVKRNAYDLSTKTFTAQDDKELHCKVASSLLVCIGDIFIDRLERARLYYPMIRSIAFVGGVACNAYLRTRIKEWASAHDLSLYVPSPQFCTDNGAMIAFVGAYKAQQGAYSSLYLDIE